MTHSPIDRSPSAISLAGGTSSRATGSTEIIRIVDGERITINVSGTDPVNVEDAVAVR